MKEDYIVKFNYLKPPGFWIIGAEETVEVECTVETCNHDLAQAVIEKKYGGCGC
jgi:hypothetical protein